jgi:hypothetical protein
MPVCHHDSTVTETDAEAGTIAQGRAALARGDYEAAYRTLVDPDVESMSAEETEALADAAWWTSRLDDAARSQVWGARTRR